MNNFMMRPRALKAGHMRTNVIAGGSSMLMGEGWGAKMIITPLRSQFFTTYHGWTEDQWQVPVPGIYRLVRIADGGGGGTAGQTASPGFVNQGYGGSPGEMAVHLPTLKTSASIRVGTGGDGGDDVLSSIGPPGSNGYGVVLSGVGSSPPAGTGGQGGSPGNGATEAQRLGAIGPTSPSGIVRGSGGDGGNSASPAGRRGAPGEVYLELIG